MAGIFDRMAGASGADETELTAEPVALDDGMADEQPAIQVDERRTPQRVTSAILSSWSASIRVSCKGSSKP